MSTLFMELRSAMHWLLILAIVITPTTAVVAQDATTTESNSIYKPGYTEADKKALENHKGSSDLAPPGNDNFANATPIGGSGLLNVSNVDATAETGEPNHGAGRGGINAAQNSIWFKYVASVNGVMVISTLGDASSTLSDTVLSAYTGNSVNALTPVAENDDYPGQSFRSTVTFTVFAGSTYYIAADGYAAGTGSFLVSYSVGFVAPNNNLSDAIDLTPSGHTSPYIGITGSTFQATGESGEMPHTPTDSEIHSIWYKWTPSQSYTVTFSTRGSLYDTTLAVYTGSTLASLTQVGNNDDFNGTRSQVTFFATAGVTYRIAVDGFAQATGNTLLSWDRYRAEGSKKYDFDGDMKTDFSIFRPNSGQWWTERSSTVSVVVATFGNGTDRTTPGDFTGDGKVDIALWRPSNANWYILRSDDSTFYSVPYGTAGDIPVVGNFDADNRADNGVFRPSTGTWYVPYSFWGGNLITQFGQAGDIPVPADYDGDGYTDIAIYRPSNGQWWIKRSRDGVIAATFGSPTDKPVVGDYTGDGRADIAIWRPSTGEWFILRSEDSSYYSVPFGISTDLPAPGDYDGDNKTDVAVFRGSAGTWYVNRSTAGSLIKPFGTSGDRPTAASYIP